MSAGVIKLKHHEWAKILGQLKEEYKATPSIFLIRDKMRRELGFTVRHHTDVVEYKEDADHVSYGYRVPEVHLDFYDERQEVFFRMKYL